MLPYSSKYRATPEAPVPDDERESLVARLNEAYATGLIPAERYPVLLDRVFEATILGDLAEVVVELPAKDTFAVPAAIESGVSAPGELVEARAAGKGAIWLAAALGGGALVIVLLLVLILL